MNPFQNASESTKKLNPHLFGNLGGLEAKKSKPVVIPPLVSRVKKFKGGEGGVAVVVTLIAHRRTTLDSDNAVGACKPLRDGIAASLGIDDSDRRVEWQYSQVRTAGREGVCVTIEKL